MPAYVVAEVEVTDPAVYEEYRKLVPATVARYGGKFLVRGGTVETKEGGWQPKRLVCWNRVHGPARSGTTLRNTRRPRTTARPTLKVLLVEGAA